MFANFVVSPCVLKNIEKLYVIYKKVRPFRIDLIEFLQLNIDVS